MGGCVSKELIFCAGQAKTAGAAAPCKAIGPAYNLGVLSPESGDTIGFRTRLTGSRERV
jgi:hypothetical protein